MQVKCVCCDKEFSKFPKDVSVNNFCSRSCSAKVNNIKFPKRKLSKECRDCGIKISGRSTFCKVCFENTRIGGKTKAEMTQVAKGGNTYRKIRHHARTSAKNHGLLKKPCDKCGYDKHVEICHIKSIKSFPDTSLLYEINHIDNLVQLCPNCHWEFDYQPSGLTFH